MATRTPHELPVYARLDVEFTHGEGVFLFDADGRRYLDFYGGHATALLGYGHPGLVETLEKQARTLFFQTNAVELAVRRRAADRLAALAPAGLEQVFFVNSGAEANENALRIACRATGRSRVVALRGGFHGRTAAAACTSDGHERWYGFPGRPFEVTFVEPDDVGALEAAVGDDTAALILEPVQGLAGARALDHGFIAAARELAAGAGALLIADEIQCGMGRCGERFAIDAAGVSPDLLTTAKGIAGGFPCGAVIAAPHAVEGLGIGDLGTTFGGGPLAAALVETVIDALEAPGFLQHVQAMSAAIREHCVVGPVQAIQGAGLLLGLRTSRPAREISRELLERGIVVGGARDPHIVRLLPPLVIDEAHVAELATALEGITP